MSPQSKVEARRGMDCGGMTPLWLHGGQGESAWELAGILNHPTVQEKRRHVSAVQGGGAPPYGLRRHDAALVARWTGQSASELAGILNHPTGETPPDDRSMLLMAAA